MYCKKIGLSNLSDTSLSSKKFDSFIKYNIFLFSSKWNIFLELTHMPYNIWPLARRPEANLLNKISSLAAALGVTKFKTIVAINLVTLLCCLSPTWRFNKASGGTSGLSRKY